jgi:hypothetical protein
MCSNFALYGKDRRTEAMAGEGTDAGRPMIRYDEHAEFQIERRCIVTQWVENMILDPDETETKGSRRSFLKRLPGRHVMLHVVTALNDPEYVITAYFDRTKPCG